MGIERLSSDLRFQQVQKEWPDGFRMISIQRHRTLDGIFVQTSPKDRRLLHLMKEKSDIPGGVPPAMDTLPTNLLQIVTSFF